MKETNTSMEPIGQNLIKLISNLCFSVFVFSVLIFTVIAITYQPPDPWLESAPALTKFFTKVENATFKDDNSILKTGEDLQTVPPAPSIPLKDDNSTPKTDEDLQTVPPAPSVPLKDDNSIPKTGEDLQTVPPAPSAPLKDDNTIAKTGEDLQTVPPAPSVPLKDDNAIPKTGEDLQTVPPAPSVPLKDDNSTLKTGDDDLKTLPPSPSVPPVSSITEAVIEKSEEVKNLTVVQQSECDVLRVVNCSDPHVLIAVERFNLKLFKSIVFLEYQTPVNGSKANECDVAWRFRNKKEKSWRKYRDFRRFRFGYGENCTYKIVRASGWHSGVNARRSFRSRVNGSRSVGNAKVAPAIRDDEINDTIPTLGSEMNFRKGRYLYYSRGGDYCKGMNQYMWSFLCGLGEAMYLNRTFVMDLSLCLAANYNPSDKDEEGKDFRYYFDFEHLKEVASIVEEGEFLRDWKKWDRTHKRKLPVKKVVTHKVAPMQLKKDKSTVIWRQFDAPEPENYWYRVCEGQAAKYIQRPWHALWKSKRLMNIVTEISGRMDWDFDAVHVVRGEKAQNKVLWPHLDSDTSPDALLWKLQGMIHPWRNLYVATNEPFYNYFDKLRSQYKVHLLDDYKELWSNTSEWYNYTTLLNNGRPVEFDGYMRVAVDTEVFYRAKTRVETFYNLTKDCKDGINTC